MEWTGKLWLVRAPMPPVGCAVAFEGKPAAIRLRAPSGARVWAHVTEG